MRTLITGCSGFIGSNLLRRCVDEGMIVHGVDDLSSGRQEFMHKVPGLGGTSIAHKFFRGDFADDVVVDLINRWNYDVVFHIAAVPRVSYSVEHPLQTNDVNVSKTLALMNACRNNVGRIVFASSSSVYGGADVLPTKETEPKNPKSPYALQKLIIEQYLKLYSDLYDLDSACMRFFNVFGPNQVGGSPYSTAVSSWLTAIKQGKPLRSDGTGEQSRDLSYVDNTVDACIRAGRHPEKLKATAFNVACGARTSNNEIMSYLKVRYPNIVRVDAPWRAGDVMHTQADVSKAKDVLGYEPLVGPWEGIEKTCDWYDQNWDSWVGKLL